MSVTTVSHALNDKGRIDAATRERITITAERLGYRPDRTARRLRSGRSASTPTSSSSAWFCRSR